MSVVTLADLFAIPGAPSPAAPGALGVTIVRADDDPRLRAAHRALRRRAFVEEQGLFAADDTDDHDGAASTRVLVALSLDGDVVGGVRLNPDGDDPGLGWWRGSRLVCAPRAGRDRGVVGAALVRRACLEAADAGALRFDAHVQERHVSFFAQLGWTAVRELGAGHVLMRHPMTRIADLAARTKGDLGPLLEGALGTPSAFLGDDGVPVPGSDVVVATDGILPAMVERDPVWAGWCGMLVTAHDLSAMGARPVGVLDALGARDAAHAALVVRGLRAGAEALDLPVLGGHTQLGVAGALSVTGLGRTASPVAAGGGRVGDALTLSADLAGGWRAGYGRTQWDSSTGRSRDELAAMLGAVATARPHAAKDVSMAGIAGTTGMLAEASGTGAVIDVTRVPRPAGVDAGDWMTCFPGFAMVTVDDPGASPVRAGAATTAVCGALTSEPGVRLRWPDGDVTTVVPAGVTGLGPALPGAPPCDPHPEIRR